MYLICEPYFQNGFATVFVPSLWYNISEMKSPTSLQVLKTPDSLKGKVLVHEIKLHIELFHLKYLSMTYFICDNAVSSHLQ